MTINKNDMNKSKLVHLSNVELRMVNGGDTWSDIFRKIGYWIGMATIPNMEHYDREAELEALKNYGAPY